MSKVYTAAPSRSDRGAIKVLRRSGCSIIFSTGSSEFAASSSPKYMRVARPMLMPREASQKLTCGAIILRPLRPATLPGPRPAAKAAVECLILLVRRMIVAAGGIGLPRLNQHVLGKVARAVEDAPLDDNTLASHAGTCDVAAEIILEDFKARLLRYQTDVDIGTGRLRWC